MTAFGNRLESMRNGMTQKAFAASIQTPINTYTNWVRGIREPSMSAIVNLCTHLGVSADWLLGLSSSSTPSVTITNSPGAVGGSNNTVNSAADCENCKFKRLAEALKAVQAG